MFGDFLLAETPVAAREALVAPTGSADWRTLAATTRTLEEQFQPLSRRRVGLGFRPTAAGFAALGALDRLGCDVFLLDGSAPWDEALRLGAGLRLGAVVQVGAGCEGASLAEVREVGGEAGGSSAGSVTILTSGSSGTPKAVRHSWASLSRPVRIAGEGAPPRWLLTYRPHLYAGLQVVLQCFLNRGTLVVPADDADPQAIATLMRDAEVQFTSATPSYWRRLLLLADPQVLRASRLSQITLGGEVVDQPLLDSLAAMFPTARLVHIYATSELGRCFSVTDRKAGFPRAFVGQVSPDGIELKVDGGELLVRSANAMQGYDPLAAQGGMECEGWFRTGDLVEIREQRVYFVGRRSDIINVGGNKVHPLEVERIVRKVPGVAEVRVYGISSSLAGQLVACDVVAHSGFAAEDVRTQVAARCMEALASYQRPRLIKMVDSIDLARSGKIVRRAGE